VFDLGSDGLPIEKTALDAPNKGGVKSITFTPGGKLHVASGDGALVVHIHRSVGWEVTHTYSI
jgi:hypothetical protein